jgi:chaperone required for assembly of F1-ATPase
MPIMTLLSTAIDQIQYNDNTTAIPIEDLDTSQITKTVVIENCLKYLPTDTLLFFTTESDRILLNKQRKHLSPIIKGLNRSIFGEAALTPTTDVTSKVKHSEETVNRIRGILQRMVSLIFLSSQFPSRSFHWSSPRITSLWPAPKQSLWSASLYSWLLPTLQSKSI